jgi:glutamate dehydrogenase (NADP+)
VKKIIFLLLAPVCLLMVLSPKLSPARTYYVNASQGSDTNPGFSPNAAWKTPDRVNLAFETRTVQAGDTVAFKRGNTFTGALRIAGSGQAGKPVVIDEYGEGAVPVIDAVSHQYGVSVSGSGNVAQYAVEKINHLGGKAVTLNDSNGYIVDDDGITPEKLEYVFELKNVKRGRIKEYADKFKSAKYHEGAGVWTVPVDVALPCATQNELNGDDAKMLLKNGCICVAEGANMPSTPDAVNQFVNAKIFYGPGKAANAGGVSTSGLEMSQNSLRLSWSREEVDQRLHGIMKAIHAACRNTATAYGQPTNYVLGANIAGFMKVADSMLDQGVV